MKDKDDSAEPKKQSDDFKAGIVSLRKEMAEREKAEAALRQSEQDYRNLFENAHDAIIIFLPEGEVILEVNKRACDLYGFDRSEFIGMSFEKITKDVPRGKKHIQATLDKGHFHHLESVHYRKDGTEMSVEINASVVNYQGNWAIQCINRDITERKRALEARLQSEMKFRKLVEQSLQGLVIAQGLPPRLVFANLALADILGYTVTELLSLSPEGLQGLVHPEDRALFFSNYQDRLKGKPVPSRYEFRTLHKDGSVRWVEILSNRIDYSGQPAVQAAFLDITTRKEAERELGRLNRTLKMVTACNRAVVQAAKEAEFLYEICLLAVEVGGYRLAWVGFADQDPEKTVRPAAQAGYEVGYLESVKISWDENSQWSQGPTGTAIRTGKPVVCRNNQTDPTYARWRGEATKRGYASSIALPLVVEGRALGALNIYAAEADAFDNEEVTLLTELADDLAYGIRVLRTRAASHRMEEALRDSEEKYRLLVENSQQGILVLQDGKIQYANPRTVQHSGYSLAELTSRPFLELIHPEDRAMVSERYEKRLKGKEIFDVYQFRFLDKQGRVQWVEANSVQVGWKGRLASLSFLSDITERKRAEEAVKESDSKYRGIVDHSLLGIYITQGHIMKFCNQRLAEIFGYGSPEELFGISIRDLIAPESWETVDREVKRRESGEVQEVHYEFKGRRKDGQIVDLEVLGGRILYEGRPAIQGSMIDVTERKRLEERVLQMQKMEAIGRLSGGVAHDFNNLLQGVTSYAEMALQKLPENDPLRKYLEGIEETVEKGASLTHQLLAFSRKQVFQPVVIDINEIVRDSEKMLRHLIGEDIEIVTHLAPKAGRVKVDPIQIEQVVMNLTVNARDAMPQGGRLTFETAAVELDSAFVRFHPDLFQGPHVMLTVSDTGFGMDAKTLAHIFEPFFTTKEKGKGTGLGLATVYGIVRQSEGGVDVQSTLGRGTTFKVYFPSEGQEANATNAVATLPELPRGTETVLLVEDEGELRGMIRENLSHAGYTVLEAENGEAALRVFTEHPETVHLLIADVVMPKMSGPDLARHLAAHHPELKVIFISGYPNDTTFSQGLKPLGLAFLQKPFKPHVLLRKVREVLDTL